MAEATPQLSHPAKYVAVYGTIRSKEINGFPLRYVRELGQRAGKTKRSNQLPIITTTGAGPRRKKDGGQISDGNYVHDVLRRSIRSSMPV